MDGILSSKMKKNVIFQVKRTAQRHIIETVGHVLYNTNLERHSKAY